MSGCLRVIVGVFVAVALLGAGGYVVANYYIKKYGTPPKKPVFAEEYGTPFAAMQTRAPNPPKPTVTPSAGAPIAPTPGKTATPTPTASPKGDLAKVIWSEGLLLREQPTYDSGRSGGVAFNTQVYILETSPDQLWQKVQVRDKPLQGWVKAGNLEKLDPNTPPVAEPAPPIEPPPEEPAPEELPQ